VLRKLFRDAGTSDAAGRRCIDGARDVVQSSTRSHHDHHQTNAAKADPKFSELIKALEAKEANKLVKGFALDIPLSSP
jgi:hypothetical protein